MKIGVIADTHSFNMPRQVIRDLQAADMIIHAGDFCSLEEVRALQKLGKPFKAVYGNMDDHEVRAKLPAKEIFTVEGVRIGLYHGEGAPEQVLNFVREEFNKDKVDAVVFGHSHQAFSEKIDGRLYFNPGSPTDMARTEYCSYGILQVNGGMIEGKIIKVKG